MAKRPDLVRFCAVVRFLCAYRPTSTPLSAFTLTSSSATTRLFTSSVCRHSLSLLTVWTCSLNTRQRDLPPQVFPSSTVSVFTTDPCHRSIPHPPTLGKPLQALHELYSSLRSSLTWPILLL